MHVVLSAGHSPRRWRRREIGRASDPVAAAALVAGTGRIGARWISREAVDCGGSGWDGCVARSSRGKRPNCWNWKCCRFGDLWLWDH